MHHQLLFMETEEVMVLSLLQLKRVLQVRYHIKLVHLTDWQNKAVEGRQPLSGAQRLELAAEMMENDFGFSQDGAINWMLTNRRDYRDWDSRGRVDTDWAELVSNQRCS